MKKTQKKITTNIAEVLFSNITTIAAGIIIGFIIPKVITIDGYGYYKTFTLYATYTGLFSFGIIDGIVLEYGGIDYEDYNKSRFRSYFRWYLVVHLVWAGLLILTSLFFKNSNYLFIIVMLAFYMLFANFVGYFQQISQITQRFKEYSIVKIIQSVMRVSSGLIMIGIFFLSGRLVNYKIYIGLSVLEFLLVALGYFYTYKSIIIGAHDGLSKTKGDILHLSVIGFPLLFANLCSTLILSLDRQFVNILFTNAEYAIYAFAYNMLALVTVATSAVSTVLYPVLKRTNKDTLKNNYSDLIGAILAFVYGALAIYFPLCKFVKWFLPNYADSLVIFRVIFPGLAMSSAITVIMHNYYKTLGDNLLFFIRSIVILIISAGANLVAYLLFHSTVSISIASIITMLIWYLYIEQYFVQNFGYKRKKNLSYLLIMMAYFYLISAIEQWMIGLVLYIAGYVLTTMMIQKRTIISMSGKLGK